ncbi:perlucin-like [Pecten maximus]|uniref:perlucin-like n=1 Tax=Pecten maximus TaxID=6579 RepID=UPI0014585D01|nr:perlucin-like [Pecten maximus]
MLVLIYLLSTCLVGAYCQCPYGFDVIKNSNSNSNACYLIVEMSSTWIEAKQYCDVLGGDLAAFETEDEMSPVRKMLQEFLPEGESSFQMNFWVDGTDIIEKGKFYWMGKNGNQERVSYYKKSSNGQTDNANLLSSCLELGSNRNFGMSDQNCSMKQGFICEASKYSDNEE